MLSISIGIVNTRLTPVNSYAQLASVSTEIKKAAKKLPGSSVVINRRNSEEYSATGGEVVQVQMRQLSQFPHQHPAAYQGES